LDLFIGSEERNTAQANVALKEAISYPRNHFACLKRAVLLPPPHTICPDWNPFHFLPPSMALSDCLPYSLLAVHNVTITFIAQMAMGWLVLKYGHV
jgi:hypothetical protein